MNKVSENKSFKTTHPIIESCISFLKKHNKQDHKYKIKIGGEEVTFNSKNIAQIMALLKNEEIFRQVGEEEDPKISERQTRIAVDSFIYITENMATESLSRCKVNLSDEKVESKFDIASSEEPMGLMILSDENAKKEELLEEYMTKNKSSTIDYRSFMSFLESKSIDLRKVLLVLYGYTAQDFAKKAEGMSEFSTLRFDPKTISLEQKRKHIAALSAAHIQTTSNDIAKNKILAVLNKEDADKFRADIESAERMQGGKKAIIRIFYMQLLLAPLINDIMKEHENKSRLKHAR